tara:strand:+ start:27637 stop:28041 length:405 start_codon:yes stop_codon:yes gene_type:complete
MPALEKETKLVMTILFVGAISGTNVYFYAKYGDMIAFNNYAHALVFGLMTIGGILTMKAIFDLALNDYIEMALLDRRIAAYWAKKQRDDKQREKIRSTMQQYRIPQQQFTPPFNQPQVVEERQTVTPSFLAKLE